jgi:hypothetical protein
VLSIRLESVATDSVIDKGWTDRVIAEDRERSGRETGRLPVAESCGELLWERSADRVPEIRCISVSENVVQFITFRSSRGAPAAM